MSASKKEKDLEGQEDALNTGEFSSSGISGEKSEGNVRISEEVIAQIAIQALLKVNGVQPASPGLVANLRIGKKTSGGVRISVEEGDVPAVVVDAYIATKYGLRIPDISWDVQESIKKTLEQYTGYNVKAVNVFVQGVFFDPDQTAAKESRQPGKSAKKLEPDIKD